MSAYGGTGVVGRMLPTARHQVGGFRCFNVSGPREQHKGGMASVASHPSGQLREHGRAKSFGENGGDARASRRRIGCASGTWSR